MDDLISWHASLKKGIEGVFPGVYQVVVSSGGRSYPADPNIAWLVERMSTLKAGDLMIEAGNGKMLVVKYDYGDLAVAAHFTEDLSPADLSRLIRLTFTGRSRHDCHRLYVPAADIERLARMWKRSIGYIFGEAFAERLVEAALRGSDRNAMTPGDLDAARAFISSALGDCLILDKVNK